MPYRCKRCGSVEVYHSCAVVLGGCRASIVPALPAMIHIVAPSTPSHTTTCRDHGGMRSRYVCHQANAVMPCTAQSTDGGAVPDIAPTVVATTTPTKVLRMEPSCVRCGTHGAENVKGMKWCYATQQRISVLGDCLCRACRRQLCDELVEFIPMPPGKPGAYLIVRSRYLKRVCRRDGITLLWLSGHYLAASALKRSSVKTVCRRNIL
jgi:hypothetical protein